MTASAPPYKSVRAESEVFLSREELCLIFIFTSKYEDIFILFSAGVANIGDSLFIDVNTEILQIQLISDDDNCNGILTDLHPRLAL